MPAGEEGDIVWFRVSAGRVGSELCCDRSGAMDRTNRPSSSLVAIACEVETGASFFYRLLL